MDTSTAPTPPETKKNYQPSESSHSRVHIRVELAPGTRLQIQVTAQSSDGAPLDTNTYTYTQDGDTGETVISSDLPTAQVSAGKSTPSSRKFNLLSWMQVQCQNAVSAWNSSLFTKRISLEAALLILAVAVYLLTRLIRLADYPIYFFTDEAVQTVLAQDFIRDGMRGYDKVFFPTFFYNMYQYNLGVSVYLQVIPYLLLGKSILVTRGITALTSVIAALSLGMALSQVFKKRYVFSAVMLLSIIPAWFLHSRTAFETSLATSFYAGYLYFYLLYRNGSPRALYGAILLAALSFYSYSPARLIIGLTGVLLLFSDIRYHWQQRKFVLRGLVIALLLAVPYLRFSFEHPNAALEHLIQLNSYWIQNIPWTDKLTRFFGEYLHGLNPLYWFLSNDADLARHQMDSYGHVFLLTLPLALAGLIICLAKIRSSSHRTLLIFFLAAPSGAALVALGITRSLAMVIPLAALSGLGLTSILEWAEKRWRLKPTWLALPVFLVLAGVNIGMLRAALQQGSTWYSDYGLGGMQWGAKQIVTEINDYLSHYPDTKITLSPSWANGTDTVMRFFYEGDVPFQLGSIEGYMNEQKPLDDSMLFIMIPQEYGKVQKSAKFSDIRLEKTLDYPNGEPGFYFVRLRYADNIVDILKTEQEARKVLQQANLTIAGQEALVKYSHLDMGEIGLVFDGDLNTLVRTLEANPLVIEITFFQPQPLSGLTAKVGGPATEITSSIFQELDGEAITFSTTVRESPNPRLVDLSFDGEKQVKGMRIQVRSVNDQEPAHVHLWEIDLQEPK
jgi:4-amino-4-deoxy-L-arabinose transferase-like glycosyltransferase